MSAPRAADGERELATPEPSWDAALRLSARGSAQPGVETLHGARPALLNAQTAGALTSVVLAAFVLAAAHFRSELAAGQLDLIASALRTAGLAFGVRASIHVSAALRGWWNGRRAQGASLSLGPTGLYLRLGERETSVRRDELLGIGLRASLPSRTLPAPAEPLLLSLVPRQGQPRLLEIPPYFAQTSEIALARLERWWGDRDFPELDAEPTPGAADAPDLHYERAAGGQLSAYDVLVPEGSGYLLRAPYIALLGALFALDVYASAGATRVLIAMPVLAACLLSVAALAAWLLWMKRRHDSRRGIGMLLTRAELLLRGPHGVVAIPWPQLASSELKLSARWSPFVGSYPVRTLVLSTNTGERMLFDQSFLGIPLEGIDALCRYFGAPLD